MNITNLLTPSYIFDPVPGAQFAYRWPLFILFALIIGLSFYVHSYLKNRPNHKVESRFLGKIPSHMRELGMLGLLTTFFRDQNVPYFGMRLWTELIILACALYAVYVWRNYKKNYPLMLVLMQSKKTEDKYVPKPKKKRAK